MMERGQVEEAYYDSISKRVQQAIEKLTQELYPDGIPPHEQVIEWFKYLPHSKPMPEGWVEACDLQGTHHGEHARLIRKVKT